MMKCELKHISHDIKRGYTSSSWKERILIFGLPFIISLIMSYFNLWIVYNLVVFIIVVLVYKSVHTHCKEHHEQRRGD